MKSFKCRGMWWLPDRANAPVAGTLRFSPRRGATLELIGALSDEAPNSQPDYGCLFGEVDGLKFANKITLIGAFRTKYTLGGTPQEEIYANRVYAGGHFQHESDISTCEAVLGYSGFPSWMYGVTGLRQPEWSGDEAKVATVRIIYETPPTVDATIPQGTLSIRFGPGWRRSNRKWTIRERIHFKLHISESISPEQLNEQYSYPLQNFFTFATDHPCSLTKAAFVVQKPDMNAQDVEMYVSRTFNDSNVARNLHPFDMLFTYRDVQNELSEILGKWLTLATGQLAPAVNNFFAMQYKPHSFLDARFLAIIQTLILYHDLRYEKIPDMPDDSNNPRPSTTYEIAGSLRKLMNDGAAVMRTIIGESADDFVDQVESTRNYLVHRFAGLKQKAASGRDLFWVTEKLQWLMKACILREIGVVDEKAAALAKRNMHYSQLCTNP